MQTLYALLLFFVVTKKRSFQIYLLQFLNDWILLVFLAMFHRKRNTVNEGCCSCFQNRGEFQKLFCLVGTNRLFGGRVCHGGLLAVAAGGNYETRFYWGLKKFSCRASLLFYCFLVKKRKAFKSFIYFYPSNSLGKEHTLRLFLMSLERKEFCKLSCLRRGQITYLGKSFPGGIVAWQKETKQVNFKMKFIKEFCQHFKSISTDCLWMMSIYCITQNIHISECECKSSRKELAMFVKGEIFEKLLQSITFLKMLLFYRYSSATF